MDDDPRTARRMALAGLAFYAVLLALCLGASALWPAAAGWAWVGTAGWPAEAMAGLAAGGLLVAVSGVLVHRTAAGQRLARTLGQLVRGLPGWAWAPLALAAGVAEEALFRGALWTALEALGGRWTALALTSLAFGAAHGGFRRGFRTWSAFALGTGVLLGGLRLATGGLLAPVVAHVLVDLVNLPLLRRRDDGGTGPAPAPAPRDDGGPPGKGVPDFLEPL